MQHEMIEKMRIIINTGTLIISEAQVVQMLLQFFPRYSVFHRNSVSVSSFRNREIKESVTSFHE